MTDALDTLVAETRQKFEARREELRPQHEAYLQIDSVLRNFDQVTTGKATRKRGTTATAGDRAARGQRPDEFFDLVKDNPGITVTEASEQMDGVNLNYLYRIAKDLVSEGRIEKRQKGYFLPASTESAE